MGKVQWQDKILEHVIIMLNSVILKLEAKALRNHNLEMFEDIESLKEVVNKLNKLLDNGK